MPFHTNIKYRSKGTLAFFKSLVREDFSNATFPKEQDEEGHGYIAAKVGNQYVGIYERSPETPRNRENNCDYMVFRNPQDGIDASEIPGI